MQKRKEAICLRPSDDDIMKLFFSLNRVEIYCGDERDLHFIPLVTRYRCLLFLEEKGIVFEYDIVKELMMRYSYLEEILKNLEEEGYIWSVPSPKDKTQRLVSLTDTGRALLQDYRIHQAQRHIDMLSFFSESEKEDIFETLSQIKEEREKNAPSVYQCHR